MVINLQVAVRLVTFTLDDVRGEHGEYIPATKDNFLLLHRYYV